jgi:hypothetical protein
MFLDSGPIYNTVLFYILFVIAILFIKPKFIYCHKTKKFKPFGCSKNQTLMCFPVVCFISVIIFYFIFLMIHIIGNYLDKK